MQTRYILFATALVAALGLGTPAFAVDSHQHATGEPGKLTLDHGVKWKTDQPLRKGMGEIRKVLAAKLEGIHKSTLTAAEYQALGATIDTQVATIVAECKLERAADANLHLIVGELVSSAETMQGKSANKPATGAVRAVEAVNRYGQYFSDPGWKPLR
ncbi:MAG TPA: hypothetical protein PLO14_07650 [Accumulibacter sp.]|uniref:hypothetical protein n=1 Tax=Accumulibacter sp. TaxID=2053492 RepID=UPI0025F1E9E2|nr:hypothetical protein [Accumulibacter sp.]MCM8597954.1 hypothetical protein [Accumulibacter sp.]MCM8662161.1 hypothetical protein [Accumulibacter sp.]HNC52098.1 hypothetical protein [Accumulibacter sp.]